MTVSDRIRPVSANKKFILILGGFQHHRMALKGRTCPCCIAMRWNLQIVRNIFCKPQRDGIRIREVNEACHKNIACQIVDPFKLHHFHQNVSRDENLWSLQEGQQILSATVQYFLRVSNTERRGQHTVWSKRRIDRLLQSYTVVRNSILNLRGVSEMRFCWIPQLAIHMIVQWSTTPPVLSSSSPAFLETSWNPQKNIKKIVCSKNIRKIRRSFALLLVKVAPHHGIAECLKPKVDVTNRCQQRWI